MANVITLLKKDGSSYIADEGEVSLIEGQFFDAVDPDNPDVGGAINTLTMTIKDEGTQEIIDSRDIISSLQPGGNLRLKLTGADNVVLDKSKSTESHLITVEFGYLDTDGDAANGVQVWRVYVSPEISSPTAPASPGWVG